METGITIRQNEQMALAGHEANKQASKIVFMDYRSRKAANTVRRQDADLALFADYLQSAGLTVGDFGLDPHAWNGITWGLVEGFVKWQLLQGYAMDSINVRLSTVKSYAQLAMKAGALDISEYAMIRTVKGYSQKETKRVDEKRKADGLQTRVSTKKKHPTILTNEQAQQLMKSDGTPKADRDALLMCLMIEHGLRVGEVSALKVSDFDLQNGLLIFYRQKVDKTQNHRLSERTIKAVQRYFEYAPEEGSVWRQGDKKGSNELSDSQGMSVRAINKRVELLGEAVGVKKLSPHDLRHYWATNATRKGTPIKSLQVAGGWNSPAMPLHYIEAEQIANEGVRT